MGGSILKNSKTMIKKIKLAVIFGGPSGEHTISLRSAREVIEHLDKQKYAILPIKISRAGKWNRSILQNKIDLAMIVGHGTFMEDGCLQAILESYQITYLFSDVLASALAMNKFKTKIVAKNTGLNIAKGLLIKHGEKINYSKIIRHLKFPIVIKPNELGSSVGANITKNKGEFITGLKEAFRWGKQVLLEEFIAGRELTVAIMGRNKLSILPVVEIKPRISAWFDYKAKYRKDGSEEICPAQIPPNITRKIQSHAKKIFEAIGCRDLARADFIWNKKNNLLYFLEINTIPGMTKTSIAPCAARVAGFELKDFLDILIKNGLEEN